MNWERRMCEIIMREFVKKYKQQDIIIDESSTAYTHLIVPFPQLNSISQSISWYRSWVFYRWIVQSSQWRQSVFLYDDCWCITVVTIQEANRLFYQTVPKRPLITNESRAKAHDCYVSNVEKAAIISGWRLFIDNNLKLCFHANFDKSTHEQLIGEKKKYLALV